MAQSRDLAATVPERRKLPDEIKAIFETTSKDFSDYAKNNGGKNDMSPEKAGDMDEWDRAILLGEYPLAAQERPKPARVSFVSLSSPSIAVPKKSDSRAIGAEFPSRVMDKEVAPPVRIPMIPQKPKNVQKIARNESVKKDEATPRALKIPIKPKQDANSIRPADSLSSVSPSEKVVSASVPTEKPISASQTTERPVAPSPNMSETLVGKIIEGQMRGVFENAPPLLQKELEKTAISEILTAIDENTSAHNIENEVWKKRLREYLTKLHEQAVSVFSDISGEVGAPPAHPLEGEQVLDYVKRVYPVILKAQALRQ